VDGHCAPAAGRSGVKIARGRLDALRTNFGAWQETTFSADFPQA